MATPLTLCLMHDGYAQGMHIRLVHSCVCCMQIAKYYMCRSLQVVMQILFHELHERLCVCTQIQMHEPTQYTYAPHTDVLHQCALNMRHHPDANPPLCTITMLPHPRCDFAHMWKWNQPNHATRCGGRHTCECDLTGTAAFILNDNRIELFMFN